MSAVGHALALAGSIAWEILWALILAGWAAHPTRRLSAATRTARAE
ncbi:MAG: hypothetical protein QOG46_2538 [Pseudonocardiales bacterium]|jgi:hypothetical protein|nr:hypothetical protein [Pseudonocardiales bacterium]